MAGTAGGRGAGIKKIFFMGGKGGLGEIFQIDLTQRYILGIYLNTYSFFNPFFI
jgi:hypothetical protein